MILENSPVVDELAAVIGKITATMNELSAVAEGVSGKINEVLTKGDKEQQVLTDKKLSQPQLEEGRDVQVGGVAEVILRRFDPHDLARYEAQIAKAKKAAQPVEKKQEPVKCQDQPKQGQRQKVKDRDRGIEM